MVKENLSEKGEQPRLNYGDESWETLFQTRSGKFSKQTTRTIRKQIVPTIAAA